MTELKARMEGGARGAGAQSQIVFYRDIFCWFDLAPALLHACIRSHHCLNMRMLKYGWRNAFSASSACTKPGASERTGRGDENHYGDESTEKGVRFLQK